MRCLRHGARLGVLVLLLAATAAFAQPELTVELTAPEPTGAWTFVGTWGDPVEFRQSSGVSCTFAWSTPQWAAYRAGWDVVDPGDPFDPGWINAEPDPLFTSTTGPAFADGVHLFVVTAVDAVDATTWGRFLILYEDGVPVRTVRWGDLQAAMRAAR